ncbi:MAG: NAD(P)-dependent oxidoreductase [Planctomycetota bacterium]|jgi:D-3-phosphoglycerate dehydrogenase
MSSDDLVLVVEPIADAPMRWLESRVRTQRIPVDDPRFEELLPRARGLVVRTYARVDDRLLARAGRLAVVGRAGVGYDNVDVVAASTRGVEVVYTPGANTQAVVELVLATLLGHLRPAPRVTTSLDAEQWRTLRARSVAPRQLGELTVGILGLGRIGRSLARTLGSLGCGVLYDDLLEIPPEHRHGAQAVDVGELFERADVLSIHVDGRPSNRGFVGDRLIARLKPDATIVNTSRGFVVDNGALAAFLRRSPDAAALLDVHEPEPIEAASPLLGLANAHLTPHLGGATALAHERMGWVVRDVVAVLEGRPPEHPVPRPA